MCDGGDGVINGGGATREAGWSSKQVTGHAAPRV